MPSTSLTNTFLVISILGCSATAIRLFRCGLSARYRVFTWFFAFAAVNHVWPLLIDRASFLYFYFWIVTEPVFRVFYVLTVLEMYRLMTERYKGLYSLARWAMYGTSAVSVLVSVMMLLPRITPAMPQKSVCLGYAYAFNRGVDFSLTVFILLILLFLSQYPIALSRNLLAHATLCSLYFLSSGTYGMVRRMIGGAPATSLNLVLSGIVASCTVAWFLLLSPKGEGIKAVRIRFSAGYEAQVLEKLDALNQILLKSAGN